MKEIGEFLKQARINNGVSLDEAAEDLNLSSNDLENIEEGNVKAFKDVYALKEMAREYSKYLGLDADKIMDEFNDFMFEHTSKISLDEIKEAKKASKEEEEKPKVISPYTYIPKEKFSLKKINFKKVLIPIGIILLIGLIILIFNMVGKDEEKRTNELMGRTSEYYEYTN